jgi:ankyrin repeat protein
MTKNFFLIVLVWALPSLCMERTIVFDNFKEALLLRDAKTKLWKDTPPNRQPYEGRCVPLLGGGELLVFSVDESRDAYLGQSLYELLKGFKIDVNAKDNAGTTALMYAVECNALDVLKELVCFPGIDINARNKFGLTALMLAARKGSAEGIEKLLQVYNHDVNAKDDEGTTALMWAVKSDVLEVLERLMRLRFVGIDVNAKNRSGMTALMLASSRGNLAAVNRLLRSVETRVNNSDNEGKTELIWAIVGTMEVEVQKEIVARLLREPGIDIYARDKTGKTALNYAVELGKVDVAQLLWVMGADDQGVGELNQQMQEARKEGRDVLNNIITALNRGDLDALMSMLRQGYSIEIHDAERNNPLHLAVMANHGGLAEWLIEQNIKWVFKKNKELLTPLDLVFGLWGDQNEEWNKFLGKLPATTGWDIEKAKKNWQAIFALSE